MKSVYMLKNLENGKAYIGSTYSVKYRAETHFKSLRTHRHKVEDLQADFDKYGPEAFKVVEIGEFPDDSAVRMEIFYQYLFRTKEREKGYNYKDKTGTSPAAIRCKLRENSHLWRMPESDWGYLKKLWSLPLEQRRGFTKEQYQLCNQ